VVKKHYYKVVDEYGEVVAVGYGYNENEITVEEYNRLREEILNRAIKEEVFGWQDDIV
jgi:hypothetical protein